METWLSLFQLTIKGEFKTAFVADNSIDKIKSAPQWSKEEFERAHTIGR